MRGGVSCQPVASPLPDRLTAGQQQTRAAEVQELQLGLASYCTASKHAAPGAAPVGVGVVLACAGSWQRLAGGHACGRAIWPLRLQQAQQHQHQQGHAAHMDTAPPQQPATGGKHWTEAMAVCRGCGLQGLRGCHNGRPQHVYSCLHAVLGPEMGEEGGLEEGVEDGESGERREREGYRERVREGGGEHPSLPLSGPGCAALRAGIRGQGKGGC